MILADSPLRSSRTSCQPELLSLLLSFPSRIHRLINRTSITSIIYVYVTCLRAQCRHSQQIIKTSTKNSFLSSLQLLSRKVPVVSAWELIRRCKQKLINESNQRENSNRVSWTCRPGNCCTIEIADARKLKRPREGPYTVTSVYSNGTAQPQRGPVSKRTKR